MKQIFLVFMALGLMLTNAQAQKASQYDINYKICKVHDKYDACGEHDPSVVSEPKPTDDKAAVSASLRRLDTHVRVKPNSENRQISFKGNPRFSVLYDDPNGAYEGKETRINDGVKKNVNRNINYLDNSVDLPPNDGNSSTTTSRR